MNNSTTLISEFEQFLSQEYPTNAQKINIGTQYQRQVGAAGMQIIVDYLRWDIELLNISLHNIRDQGMQHIIQSQLAHPTWPNLKEFAAIKNELTSEGLRDLSKIRWDCLSSINLRQNKIDSKGVQFIVSANFQHLKVLLLGNNCIKAAGCQLLSQSNWPLFQYLDLNFNQIGNEGLAYLILAKWPHLKDINLANNRFDAQATYYLEKAQWPELSSLQLSRNNIGVINSSQLTDLGCLRISRMKTSSLKYFGYFGNNVSLNGIRILMRSKIFAEGCVLCKLTKNQFKFDEIRGYLKEFKLFCDEFQD